MKILKCKCKHDYQDATYGNQQRVCTETKSKDEYRCTVCRTVHNIDEGKKK